MVRKEWWYLRSVHLSRAEALRKARELRAKGGKARVTSGMGVHSVYVHRKG